MQDILGQALKALDAQKKELLAEVALIEAREQAVRRAFDTDKGSIDRAPSVPDDRYEEVLSYLREHPESRQADMARDLKLNSGIVSSAMKIALGRREAKADKEGRGARYTAVEQKR